MNIIPNGSFDAGHLGDLPDGWKLKSPRPGLAPIFKLTKKNGRKVLLAAGNGRDDCVGHLSTAVQLRAGRTYRFRTQFEISGELNSNKNLLFCVYSKDFNNGIFEFKRLSNGLVMGEGRFAAPGRKEVSGDVRIFFRFSAKGKAWIHDISLTECKSVPPRRVTLACVSGYGSLTDWRRVLDTAGRAGVDLVLLPEYMNGTEHESLRGPSATLMAQKAQLYGNYVAGGFLCYEKKTDRLYNTALLFDRRGRRIGRYNKVHPFSPENLDDGVTPGTQVPVFKTDFGKVGFMICYDSWFTDVAELLALKGAEIILFPSFGYYRSLMPARAADNGVRVVASSLDSGYGIWDTTGSEVTRAKRPPTCHCKLPSVFSRVRTRKFKKIEMLIATLDLSRSPSPHNWGGPMLSAPGGRRSRRDQTQLLYEEIQCEVERLGKVR